MPSFRLSPNAHIIVAPASFKGSLSALEAASAMAGGVREVLPSAHLTLLPLADGGEGLVSVLAPSMNAEIRRTRVQGPLPGQTVEAEWGFVPETGTAIIEMAAAAGLTLVPPPLRDPLLTTTYGVGELLLAAIKAGAQQVILGLGGSATNDAGAGMAEALGVRFLDRAGKPIARGGAALSRLDRIDASALDPRLSRVAIVAAVDVSNPLTGSSGAAAVYGPQKGLRPEDLPALDHALRHFARIAARDCGLGVMELPGAGAAGGLGAGAVLFLHAQLRPGIEIVLDALHFDDELRWADLVLTGEGSLDTQTLHGKVISGLLTRAKRFNVPVAAIAGKTDLSDSGSPAPPLGLADLETLVDSSTPLELAIQNAGLLLRQRTKTLLLRHLSH